MGIKTELSLEQAKALFTELNILSIHPTRHGIIDTTYILKTEECPYILKKYESADEQQIIDEERLLRLLQSKGLHTPRLVSTSKEWRIFSFLEGNIIHRPSLQNLQALGNFLGKMHACTKSKKSHFIPFTQAAFRADIKKVRVKDPLLERKFHKLLSFYDKDDGIIHGDLFPDNAKFHDHRIGVFDFIEAGNGSFHFDAGVTAMSWIAQNRKISRTKLQLFLKAYNQYAPCRLDLDTLIQQMQYAALAYALKRWLNSDAKLDYSQMLQRDIWLENFKRSESRLKVPKMLR